MRYGCIPLLTLQGLPGRCRDGSWLIENSVAITHTQASWEESPIYPRCRRHCSLHTKVLGFTAVRKNHNPRICSVAIFTIHPVPGAPGQRLAGWPALPGQAAPTGLLRRSPSTPSRMQGPSATVRGTNGAIVCTCEHKEEAMPKPMSKDIAHAVVFASLQHRDQITI